MKQPTDHRPNRREIFRSLVRYLALGGISLMSAGLIARGSAASAKDRCRRSLPCGNCAAWAGCGFPQALAARERNAKVENHG